MFVREPLARDFHFAEAGTSIVTARTSSFSAAAALGKSD
jgi:hypothetical protein